MRRQYRAAAASFCSSRQASIYLRFVYLLIPAFSLAASALCQAGAYQSDNTREPGWACELSGTRYPWQACLLDWEPKRKNTSAVTNHLPSTTPMLDASFSPKHSKCWVSLRLCSLIWHHRNVDTSDSQPRPSVEPPELYPASLVNRGAHSSINHNPWSFSLSSVWARSQSPIHIRIIRFFVAIGFQIRLAPHHWLAFLVRPRLPHPLPNPKGHALRATRRGVYYAS